MESDGSDGRTQSVSHVCKVQLLRVLVQGYALHVVAGALHDDLQTFMLFKYGLRVWCIDPHLGLFRFTLLTDR